MASSEGIPHDDPFPLGTTIVEGTLVAVDDRPVAKPRKALRHRSRLRQPGGVVASMPRAWPALLTLVVLAPLTAEVLTGSTPILVLLTNPALLLFQCALYGSGVVLVREVVRRRGLGWPSILLLGAAYGILEEALIVSSWFNPNWPDVCVRTVHATTGLCDYGRVWGTSLIWALSLTAFHATCSVAIPILLTERLYPERPAQPWLRRPGLMGFGVSLGLAWLVGGALFGFVIFRQQGYAHPPLGPYLAALALALALVWVALRLRPPLRDLSFIWTRTALMSLSKREVPRAWILRALGFVAVFAMIFVPTFFQSASVPYYVTLAVLAVLLILLAWRILAWSRKPGWGSRQELALATGALGCFILVFAPLHELEGTLNGKPMHGSAIVALIYLVGLTWLSFRAWREYRQETVVRSPLS
jgi:hypothetical protein